MILTLTPSFETNGTVIHLVLSTSIGQSEHFFKNNSRGPQDLHCQSFYFFAPTKKQEKIHGNSSRILHEGATMPHIHSEGKISNNKLHWRKKNWKWSQRQDLDHMSKKTVLLSPLKIRCLFNFAFYSYFQCQGSMSERWRQGVKQMPLEISKALENIL